VKISVISGFIFLLLISPESFSQSTKQQFKKLSCPEKWWICTHPFVAKKALRISLEARAVAENMQTDTAVGHSKEGGRTDAFRHAYWMARLSQEMCWRKARRLGKAHEKGNYLAFKKQKTEEGEAPDSIASAMDLYNNETGIAIGRKNKQMNREKLQLLIRQLISEGKMKFIRKDALGNWLDCEGRIVDLQLYQHIWNTPRCLVDSNH
jgi:hypothetical protein